MARSRKFDVSIGPAYEMVRYTDTQLWMTDRWGHAQEKVAITPEELALLNDWNTYGHIFDAVRMYESKLRTY